MSDINRSVHLQKKPRCLKFCIQVEEELYYPCSQNKGADQLRSYREAEMVFVLCMQNVGFLMTRLNLFFFSR